MKTSSFDREAIDLKDSLVT